MYQTIIVYIYKGGRKNYNFCLPDRFVKFIELLAPKNYPDTRFMRENVKEVIAIKKFEVK